LLFSLLVCFSLFLYLLCFPSPSPAHSRYHHCYYYKLENT
jgi:hypothetical protein